MEHLCSRATSFSTRSHDGDGMIGTRHKGFRQVCSVNFCRNNQPRDEKADIRGAPSHPHIAKCMPHLYLRIGDIQLQRRESSTH